jgi:ABC-type antimicrobial peptide transport system permease subunit
MPVIVVAVGVASAVLAAVISVSLPALAAARLNIATALGSR